MADHTERRTPKPARSRDARLDAARYKAEEAVRAAGYDIGTDDADLRHSESPTATDRALYVETAIQQAIRRGDFDDLPGSGKPLEGLGDHHDPDWWIRRKIQTEKLTGLGPPALMLRTEDAEFADRADALTREQDVRDYVDDFNRRVIDARRQLQGGPPVVTSTRDVDAEVAAWRERRAARAAASTPSSNAPRRTRSWFRRG